MDMDYNSKRLEEFKQVYREKGRFDFEAQVPYLSYLAEHYEKRFNSSRYWIDAIKAHALYNSCAVRASSAVWQQKVFRLQESYWNGSVTCSYQDHQKLVEKLKRMLKKIRVHVRLSLKDLHELFQKKSDVNSVTDADYLSGVLCDQTPQIMSNCVQHVKGFLQQLISYAVNLCMCSTDATNEGILSKFSIVGFGSVAQGETTPYSDFGLMFLIADENDVNRHLFQKLAMTCYFLINNIGETNLNTCDIEELLNWFHDKATCGVRIEYFKMNELMPTGNTNTVNEMVGRCKHIYENPEADRGLQGDLSIILSTATHLYGNESLLFSFKEDISRVIRNMERGTVLMSSINADLEDNSFTVNESITELKSVKEDIFRFPSRLLFNLSLYFNLSNERPAKILDDLEQKGYFSRQLKKSLSILYWAVQYARLACYSYFGSQREDMTIQLTHPTPSKGRLPWSIPRSLLTLILMYLTPVKEQMRDSLDDMRKLSECRKPPFKEALRDVKFHCRDFRGVLNLSGNLTLENIRTKSTKELLMLTRAALQCNNFNVARDILRNLQQRLIVPLGYQRDRCSLWSNLYGKLGQYKLSMDYAKKALSIEHERQSVSSILSMDEDYRIIAILHNNIGTSYCEQGQYKEALEHCNTALSIANDIYGDIDHPHISSYYDNISCVYNKQGEFEKAFKYNEKALSILINIYGDVDHTDIAKAYDNIGFWHIHRDEYDRALECFNKALSIRMNVYDHEDHSEIALSHASIGEIQVMQSKLNIALESHNKALSIQINIYGEIDHPEIATSHGCIGTIYFLQDAFEKAFEHFNKHLSMVLNIYGDAGHPIMATSYTNIGVLHDKRGEYKKALENYNKALSVFRNTYTGNHPEVAEIYDLIGTGYCEQEEYRKALEYYNRALSIWTNVYDHTNHTKIAKSYNNIGDAHCRLGEIKKALENNCKALSVGMNVYGDENHLVIATSYSNIAKVYLTEGKYTEALAYYKKAFCILLKIYGETDHPSIAERYNNIGEVYRELGEYDKALENYSKAVSTYIKVYGNVDHLTVAAAYNNIGIVCRRQGKFNKALENYNKSLCIYRKVYDHEDHYLIAKSYNNTGVVESSQGNYSKALESFHKALTIRLNVYGDVDHPETATSYHNIGMAYCGQGEYKTALKYCNQSLAMRMKVYGDVNHPHIAESHISIGEIYYPMVKWETALEHYNKAVSIHSRVYGGVGHPDTAILYKRIAALHTEIAVVCQQQGDHINALDGFSQGELDHTDIHIADLYGNIDKEYESRGELYSKAFDNYSKALSFYKRIYGNVDHPQITTLYDLMLVLCIKAFVSTSTH